MSEQQQTSVGNGPVEELEIVVEDGSGHRRALTHGEEIIWKEMNGKGEWKNRNETITYVKVNVRFKYKPPKELVQ